LRWKHELESILKLIIIIGYCISDTKWRKTRNINNYVMKADACTNLKITCRTHQPFHKNQDHERSLARSIKLSKSNVAFSNKCHCLWIT